MKDSSSKKKSDESQPIAIVDEAWKFLDPENQLFQRIRKMRKQLMDDGFTTKQRDKESEGTGED